MSVPLNIAVAGVGLIGRRHAELVLANTANYRLCAVVDPSAEGKAYAATVEAPWFSSLPELLAVQKPDGIIISTPNQFHVEHGMLCIAAGCPILVEKPIATCSVEAQSLVDAAKAANVPVLVGHHRRHNPLIQQAHQCIQEGRLGKITAIHTTCWFSKPDDYFLPEWRRQAGAGPILINSIHDIDLMRYLCGEITSVRAHFSMATRNFDVEDTAVALLRFASGALGTLSLSDTIASPWSWESTSGENREFATADQSCYLIGGTKASLSIPDLRIWQHSGGGHWKDPIGDTMIPCEKTDPLVVQLDHFANVIRGIEEPIVSAEEGLRSLKVVEAFHKSASTDHSVDLV